MATKRGVCLYRRNPYSSTIVFNEVFYFTASWWTMTKFDIDSPSVKVIQRDCPLADGAFEFVGFDDNVYYNPRTLKISLECSERDAAFREGEIAQIKKLCGQNIDISCNWDESIQSSHYEHITVEMGTAIITDITWSGRLIQVIDDFKDKYHCGITLIFSCNPYRKCTVSMPFIANASYMYFHGFGWSIPNFSPNVETNIQGPNSLLSITVTDSENNEQNYEGSAALPFINLKKCDRGIYSLNISDGLKLITFNRSVTIDYKGVTML